MTSVTTDQFPYRIHYLRRLIQRGGFNTYSSKDFFAITTAIESWLNEEVNVNGETNYIWEDTTAYGLSEKNSNVLAFRYESDLLLFRLKWGF